MGQAEASKVVISERRIIQRTRLLKQLEATNARTILLVAPAGYGKTTLARQWAEGEDVGWFSARSHATDVRSLASGIAEAIPISIDGRRWASDKALPTRKAQDMSVVAKSLIDKFGSRGETTLVIDDYQALTRSPTAERLIEILSQSDSGVRLLICSRLPPVWATARRHIYGEIFELNRDDLAFQDDEAQEVLAETPNRDEVIKHAQGWPAVIGLTAIAGSPGAPPRETMARSLHDFLTEEIYDDTLPPIQDALFDIALLPSLNLKTLHERFGDRTDEILAAAARTGLLAVSRHQIDLHPLAKDFLIEKLRESASTTERVREATARAIAEGAWDQAFGLVEKFNLNEQLEELISSSFSALLAGGHAETLARFNSRASIAFSETSAVMTLVNAEMAFRDGLLVRAQDLALCAAAGLPRSHPLKSRSYVVAGTAALAAFDAERSFRLHSQGLNYRQEEHDEHDARWGRCLALIYLEDSKCHEAARNLWTVGCVTPEARLRAATARLLVNRLGEGFAGFDPALTTGDELDGVSDPRVRTSFGNVCSYTLALRGRYGEARRVIDTALDDAEHHHLSFALPHLHWTKAMVGLGLRQFSTADAHLRAVESSAQEMSSHHLELNARTLRARMLLAQNRIEEAIALTSPEWDAAPTKAMYGEYLATRALALALGSDHAEARRVLRKARLTTSVVEVETLSATAAAIIALDTRSSRTMSQRAFDVADYLDTWDGLVCGVRSEPRLLDVLLASASNRRHLGTVLRESHDHSLLKLVGLPVERQYGRTGLLSRREGEVADLLCQGLTNKEIARTLCISEATAKVHVHHILNKLGARTRTEAVALYLPTDDSDVVSDSTSSSARGA